MNEMCSPSRDWAIQQNSPFTNLIEGIQKKNHQNVALINIFDQYCNKEKCNLLDKDGELIVWDQLAHLTPAGRKIIKNSIREAIYNIK